MKDTSKITVHASIKAPVQKVWKLWTTPEHIIKWNNAIEEWHTPAAVNDLHAGGKFLYRMEAKDGSNGFDFSGTYTEIRTYELIDYTLDDDRRVTIAFNGSDSETSIVESFETENVNPVTMQQAGWQAILDNFKKYVETFNEL